MNYRILMLGLLAISTLACDKNEDPQDDSNSYHHGTLILNEGNFMDNNGTVTHRLGNHVKYDIFQAENLRSLSGSITGYATAGERGVLLVDNSTGGQDKIEIVDAKTFKSLATVPSTEIENPREVLKINEDKVYISAWDATGSWPNTYINPGYVAVLDVKSGKITKKIPVQHGAESMVKVGAEVYVGSVYSDKNLITVIQTTNDAVSATLTTGLNPEVIGIDAQQKLWFFDGELKRLNTGTKTVEAALKVKDAARTASKFSMSKDGRKILYTLSYFDENFVEKGALYQTDISASEVNTTTSLISRTFYGVDVDPGTGQIYGSIVPSFKQAGYVLRYQEDGTLIDSIKAEIGPSKFFFQ
jgi:hypothetical protein